MALHPQIVTPCVVRPTTLSPSWFKRNLSIQKDSIPMLHRWIKVFECLVRRAKALWRPTMALRTDHTWEKCFAQQTEWGPNSGLQRPRMLYELSVWHPQSWALGFEPLGVKSRLPERLVLMTHRHDDFEWLSPRDYVDTKSWLAYEQNPYLKNWVRLGSCRRKTSPCYDILPAITRLWVNMNIQLLHDATTPRWSDLRGCTTLPRPVLPWVAAPSPAWHNNIIASMTQHLHRATASSPRQHHRQHDSAALSPTWHNIYIASQPSLLGGVVTAWLDSIVASMTRHLNYTEVKSPWQHRCQHDSAALSLAWHTIYIAMWPSHLGNTVASMTQHLHHATTMSPR
jgi:hypothetical protein